MADIEQVLLQQIADMGSIADTGDFAAELKEDHLKVVGVMKSLEMAEMVEVKVRHTIGSADAGMQRWNAAVPIHHHPSEQIASSWQFFRPHSRRCYVYGILGLSNHDSLLQCNSQ
jgi:hypothetical protein